MAIFGNIVWAPAHSSLHFSSTDFSVDDVSQRHKGGIEIIEINF